MRTCFFILFFYCLSRGLVAAAELTDPRNLPAAPDFGAESAVLGAPTVTVGPAAGCSYNNLQTAINAAPESAVLHVMQTYAGNNTPYSIFDRSLAIEGGYDSCGPNRQRLGKTTLDPGAQQSVTVLSIINVSGGSAPSRRVDLSHLIITGGRSAPANTGGGGLLVQSEAGATQVNLVDVAIVGNQRTGLLNSGGGLALLVSNQPASQIGPVRNPMVTISGTETRIAENSVEADGGGIYCAVSGSAGLISPLQMYQGVIELNSARRGGGFATDGCRDVVFANAGPILGFGDYAGGFIANSATLAGGGLSVAQGGRVVLLPSTYDTNDSFYAMRIEGNTTEGSGGGARVFGSGSELVLRDTWIVDNTAATAAGGIFVGSGASLDMDRFVISRRCAPMVDALGRSFYPPCSVIEGSVAGSGSAFSGSGESVSARIARTRIRYNQTANPALAAIDLGRSSLTTGPQNELTLISSLVHDNSGQSLIRLTGPSLTNIIYSTLAHSGIGPMIRLEQIPDQGPALMSASASILLGHPSQLLVSQPPLNTDAAAECVIANRPADASGFNSTSLYLEADPRFRDPNNGDFGLADDSPAIDFCSALFQPGEISPDLDGNPRGVPWTGAPSPVPNPGSGFYDLGALEAIAPDRLFRDRFQP